VADDLTSSNSRLTLLDQMKPSDKIFDIGPQTLANYKAVLTTCKTVLWNGPMGVFEVPPYDYGTTQLASIVARLTNECSLISVAGGGDTGAALAHAGTREKFTYLSAAGGAFLEWLEGKELPGIQALKRASNTIS
jgi:phosphoglycerate kinase